MKQAAILFLMVFIGLGSSQSTSPPNGCGPSNSPLLSSISPNGPFPISNTIFLDACNKHDLCYEPGGKPQASCDSDFLYNLKQACEIYDGFAKDYCLWFADNMYAAVDNFGENSIELVAEINQNSTTVGNLAVIESDSLSTEIYNDAIFGNEFKLCATLKNIARFNSHFKLYLFAAKDRTPGEAPDKDFQLAWFPILYKSYFRLRSGEEKRICLDTGGIIGIARNAQDLGGLYRLELWINSLRQEIGFKLADFIEGKVENTNPAKAGY